MLDRYAFAAVSEIPGERAAMLEIATGDLRRHAFVRIEGPDLFQRKVEALRVAKRKAHAWGVKVVEFSVRPT